MDARTKQNIKKAMELYFNNIGASIPEQKMTNIDGAFKYLLKLGLVQKDWYNQYVYAAEMQFMHYKMRGF